VPSVLPRGLPSELVSESLNPEDQFADAHEPIYHDFLRIATFYDLFPFLLLYNKHMACTRITRMLYHIIFQVLSNFGDVIGGVLYLFSF